MCRTMEFPRKEGDGLKIKAFFLHFSLLGSSSPLLPLPTSLTLAFPPRLNGSSLEIDGSYIRPASPAFVTLHRIVSAAGMMNKKAGGGGVAYGSTERIRAREGVLRFEVYFGEEKVVEGILRKDAESEEGRMECRCGLERDGAAAMEVLTAAEVLVAAEGHGTMSERVEMTAVSRHRSQGKNRGFRKLDQIPEGREEEEEEEGSDGGDCDDDEWSEEEIKLEMGMEEGVRWAVDVGIWVMCLGLGFLASKASSPSSKSLRRTSRLL